MITLEEGENILHVTRKHWFVMLGTGFSILVMAVLPAIGVYFMFSPDIGFLPVEVAGRIPLETVYDWFLFIYPLWLLSLWVFFFVEWTDYYLDIWIITNKRIIDVEQNGFFRREVTSFSYNQIQDITVETRGIIQTFFKFGLLHIQTAGHNRNIIIKNADRPELVRSMILRQQNLNSFKPL